MGHIGFEPVRPGSAPSFAGHQPLIRPSKMIIIASIFVAWSIIGTAHAIDLFQGWDNTDKTLYAVSCIATSADMYSTSIFLRDPDSHENNYALGESPSGSRLIAWGVGVCVARYFIANRLHGWWRKGFLGGCATIDVCYTRRNVVKFQITMKN